MAEMMILYVAFGQKYLEEALGAIASVRTWDKATPIVVYADRAYPPYDRYDVEVRVRDWKPGYRTKIEALRDFEAEDFIFLDSDTHVTGPLDRLINFAPQFGLSAAPDPLVDSAKLLGIRMPWPEEQLAAEPNTGVMLVRRSRLPRDLFSLWLERHTELAAFNATNADGMTDQPALRRVLFEAQVQYGVLPSEFNFRACYPQLTYHPPLVIHSRMPRPEFVHARLRNASDLTVWFPFGTTVSRGGFFHKAAFGLHRLRERLFTRG